MSRPLLLLCVSVFAIACGDKHNPGDAPKTLQPAAASDGSPGAAEPGVTLNREAQTRAGLETTAVAARPVKPELTAYGTLEEDPGASFTVRAAVSGTLHAASGREWPDIGRNLPANAVFGELEPRLPPVDRLNFTTQLATARADLNSTAASVAAAQAAYDRARLLNADNKNISDKALEQAAATLASERAKASAAQANVASLEASLQPGGSVGAGPLKAGSGGEVVEIFAHPGEAIEQGAPILRVARFDRLLVRVDLPIGEQSRSSEALIVAAGFETKPPLRALLVSVAPATDPRTQGISLLYRLQSTAFGLRPGTSATAFLPAHGPTRTGILIPASAVVQQNGRLWVYVQTAPDRFSRRPLAADLPAGGGYLAVEGFSPGDRVVSTGAQTLLSEEFKSTNQTDEH